MCLQVKKMDKKLQLGFLNSLDWKHENEINKFQLIILCMFE